MNNLLPISNRSLFLVKGFIQQQCRPTTVGLCPSRAASGFTMTPAKSEVLNKEFWTKNKDLKRPMSPHLTIYKFQLPATLSISHRITGAGASVVLYAGGIGALFCDRSFPEIIQLLQSTFPHSLLLATKTAIGGALIYHTLNGIRHLFWDVGYGFQLKHLYLSGYIVVALTAIGTAAVFVKG